MTLFTLTWNTLKDTVVADSTLSEALTYGATYTFYGTKPAVYHLAFELKRLGYSFITVRDALGRVMDTSKPLHDITDINPTALLK